MSEEVLEEMTRQVMNGGESHVSFVWQGGEPTLMGLPFFKRAAEFQNKYGIGRSVSNALQTNGILLDEGWASFLRNYRYLVGLSIDGPEEIHNHYRLSKGGQGSWSQAVDAAGILLKYGVEVNAISVVTDYSVKFPDAIYTFQKRLGLDYMQFIPCVETDPSDPGRAAPCSVSPVEYGRFLIRLFDLWQGDFDGPVATTSVRFFESVFHTYVGLEPPECTLLEKCGTYVVVEHNGDVFACDFFVEPEWRLGNVMTGTLPVMLNSPLQEKFGRLKAELQQRCLECAWLRVCRGGCTKDRIRDPRDMNLSHFCESYKMFFDHADSRLREMAVEWTRRTRSRAALGGGASATNSRPFPNAGRNAPCPCGSGRKYKRCCGAAVLPS